MNLQNVRVLLKTNTKIASGVTGSCFGLAHHVQKPFLTIYTIDETRYPVSNGYKLGLKGFSALGASNENWYQMDLDTLLRTTKDSIEGFYAIENVDASNLSVGDIVNLPIYQNGEKLAEAPARIKAVQGSMLAIEMMVDIGDSETSFKIEVKNSIEKLVKINHKDILKKAA